MDSLGIHVFSSFRCRPLPTFPMCSGVNPIATVSFIQRRDLSLLHSISSVCVRAASLHGGVRLPLVSWPCASSGSTDSSRSCICVSVFINTLQDVEYIIVALVITALALVLLESHQPLLRTVGQQCFSHLRRDRTRLFSRCSRDRLPLFGSSLVPVLAW